MRKGTPCLLIDKQTGRIVRRYDSVKQAAEHNGLTRDAAWFHVVKRTLGLGRHMLRLERDWQGFEVFKGRYNRPVLLTDGRRWKWVPNADEAAQLLVISKTYLHEAIRDGLSVRGVRAKFADSTLEWGMIHQAMKEAQQGGKGQK